MSAIDGPALRATRTSQERGLSRRQLMRRAVGAGVGLWLVEVTAGCTAFLWSAATLGGGRTRVGTYDELLIRNGDLPVADGFPAYVGEAQAFIVIVDPTRHGWTTGVDSKGEGSALNVRALSKRCPHLGCRPNPCLEDGWFHCPCHQSRYDRLGIKPAGEQFGPASRGMDRFAIEVDTDGVLWVDTRVIVTGPLPIELGQPGVIPPLVERGCA